MIINLFDEAFRHIPTSVNGKTSEYISYVRDNFDWSGVTIFTDNYINSNIPKKVISKHKIGWLLECREMQPAVYDNIEPFLDNFEFIITHDQQLLTKYPIKTRKGVFGGCWVEETSYNIYEKSKELSMIYSNKHFLYGHKLRHFVANSYGDKIDLFGTGAGTPIANKEIALIDYYFSIVIENAKLDNYFTEKLLDCFATGVVPVYYGCPNLGDYFDMDGVISFNSPQDLQTILPTLTPENYFLKLKAVKNNFEKFQKYAVTEDWLYTNILNDYDEN